MNFLTTVSYSTLYDYLYWIGAILDGIWIIALLNTLAGRKLRESYFHYLILLLPWAFATHFYQGIKNNTFLLAILLGLSMLLWLYLVYLFHRKWIKGLASVGIVVLTVMSVTGVLLSAFIVVDFRPITFESFLDVIVAGAKNECSVDFLYWRIIISAILFNVLCIFFGQKTPYLLKKLILIGLFLLSFSFTVSIFVLQSSSDLRKQLNYLAGYLDSNERLIATVPLLLINLCLFALYLYLQKLRQGNYEARLFAEKKRFEENRYNDANAIWENVRKVQHDIKQHLTVINGYLSEDKTKECREYISTLLPNIERMGNLIKSDNRILDYLINSKLCALENTQVVISGSVGDLSDIADGDLACLMGNILDNAIEGTQTAEEKRIELHFMRQNSNRIIICKNTVAKSVLAENSSLKSTKQTGDAHGYGTKIVAEIVAKYHGMIDYYEEFDLFGVQIILPVQG